MGATGGAQPDGIKFFIFIKLKNISPNNYRN